MTVYKGPLNVIADGQGGSVIAVTLNPGAIPTDGLTIDVSILQTPAGQQFGNILGLTVDANSTNVTSGLLSISFEGGSNLIRAANGGTTQVYKVIGQCQRITLFNNAWSTGPLNIVLWNTSPANELTSAVNVQATITAGNVTFTNSSIEIDHVATSIAFNNSNLGVFNQATNLIPAGTNGVIRSLEITIAGMQAFLAVSYLYLAIENVGASHTYYRSVIHCGPNNEETVTIANLAVLAVPFINGLQFTPHYGNNLMVIDSDCQCNVIIGWN